MQWTLIDLNSSHFLMQLVLTVVSHYNVQNTMLGEVSCFKMCFFFLIII